MRYLLLGTIKLTKKQPFLFVSSQKQADGNHAVVAVDEGGAIKFQEILPGRGHDTAISPDRKTGIIFARRPGRFAVVMDLRRQKQYLLKRRQIVTSTVMVFFSRCETALCQRN